MCVIIYTHTQKKKFVITEFQEQQNIDQHLSKRKIDLSYFFFFPHISFVSHLQSFLSF